jgi:hypothetical protein
MKRDVRKTVCYPSPERNPGDRDLIIRRRSNPQSNVGGHLARTTNCQDVKPVMSTAGGQGRVLRPWVRGW